MNDIKSLYLTAKASGKTNDISAYTEAIHELLESNPSGYISNLEYIISSDIGLQTIPQFMEKNGLPISCHGEITSILEKCIEKCNTFKKDDTAFKEALVNMESFRKKYIGCFMMESYFSDQLPENYVSVYYGSNSKGIPNRKLMAGMLEKFGEAAIPDILITANSISPNSLKTAVQFIESHQRYGNPVICEWVLEAVKGSYPDLGAELIALESKSIGRMSYEASNRNHQLYREAVITGNDQIMMEYSEDEVKAILDFISFNEYKLTWADELGLSVSALQESIYKLYEEVEGIPELTEDVATSVIPMLPSNGGNIEAIKEGQWLLNTRNKKTGDIPGYIKRNHKLDYGEDQNPSAHNDIFNTSDKSSEVQSEPVLDDFKRPSAEDMAQSYTGLDDRPEKTPADSAPMTQAERNAINNYYYYTYNNSHNRNTGSFNRDNSQHEDHSTTTKKTVDDHSYGKRISSDDNITKGNELDDNEPMTEGVGTILLATPIVLGAGLVVASVINSKIMDAKYRKKMLEAVSEIVGEKVKDDKKYLDDAGKKVSDLISKNEKDITDHFYKFSETGEKVVHNPGVFFTFKSSNSGKENTEYKSNDLLIKSDEILFGLLKKSDVKSVAESLSEISDSIKLCIDNSDDLPGDDNGGDWGYFIKAGICDGGPDDYDGDENDYDKWMKNQLQKIDESGYSVYSLAVIINGKDFLTTNFKTSVKTESSIIEAVGDADDNRPESDHPVKDIMTDIDRNLTKKQQSAKKVVQNVQNAGRAFVKPAVRTQQWISNMVGNWKDADENNIKERMADPHARSKLFSAIKAAITGGSLLKAGLLLNPVFLVLSVTRGAGKNKREFRIRNEMIGELKTELEVIDEKIKDADRVGDNQAKYKLMRFKNELNKKLLRVGGPKGWSKII